MSRRRNLCQDILYVIDWNVVSMHVRGYGRSSSLVESCTRGSQAEKLKDEHWKKAMVAFASGKDVLVSLPTAHCKRFSPCTTYPYCIALQHRSAPTLSRSQSCRRVWLVRLALLMHDLWERQQILLMVRSIRFAIV